MGDPVGNDDERDLADQRSAYDSLRSRCAVTYEGTRWAILRHAEVVAAATDPTTFSSMATPRRAIPNSLDGADHAAYRAVVDRYLTDERVAREQAQCHGHAAAIVDTLPRGVTVETIASIGVPFAVRSQSSWLGWPLDLEQELVEWIQDNNAATRSGDRDRTAEVANRFDRMIHELLDVRRDAPPTDVTGELMADTVDGRPLTDNEVVSILRNWTAGDLGSLATSVGVIVHFLATHPDTQRELRMAAEEGDHAALETAVEEILRIDDPFVSNRRVATRAVDIDGEHIAQDDLVLLNWTAANRDPLVFGDADRYDPARNAEANLVFGIGPHACPGRSLTLMELRVILAELLRRIDWIEPAQNQSPVRESPPVGGWARVPVVLR
jgi:cytochrome P450